MSTKISKAKQAERDEAIVQLRDIFPVGSTARTILRHVSASGMSRDISVAVSTPDGDVRDVTYLVARATGSKMSPRLNGGIRVGGCGMDMGFSLVYDMSRTIYPNGHECTTSDGRDGWGYRCPSNDHSNDYRAKTPEAERYALGRRHSDGGYAVSQRWL